MISPSSNKLTDSLVWKATGAQHTPQGTHTSDQVNVPRVSINPLSLFHPLHVSSFLFPTSVWYLLATRARHLGKAYKVRHLLEWLLFITIHGQEAIDMFYILYLKDITLKECQVLKQELVLPPPPLLPAPYIHYLPHLPPSTAIAAPYLPNTMADPDEHCGDELRILLHLSNVTRKEELPYIWYTAVPISN